MRSSVKSKAGKSRPSERKAGTTPIQNRSQDSRQTAPSERKGGTIPRRKRTRESRQTPPSERKGGTTPSQKRGHKSRQTKDMIPEESEPFVPSQDVASATPNKLAGGSQVQLPNEMTTADEPQDKVEASVVDNKQPPIILGQVNRMQDKMKDAMVGNKQPHAETPPVERQAAAQKFKEWYEKYTQLSDPKTEGFNEVHDRRRWIPEMCAVAFILAWTCINAATSMAKQKDIASILISIFVIGVFLVGPICGMWIDKKYCKHHEMALLKFDKPRQFFLTWVVAFLAFQFGVVTVFQLIADAIDVSFYETVVAVVAIAASVISVIYMIIPYGTDKAVVPTWKEMIDLELTQKYKRKSNVSTGKKKVSRLKFLWDNKCRMLKGMCKDLLLLGMFWRSRAPTFAKCAVIHLWFDTGCELIGAAWFIVRLFSVCICLSLLGGLTNMGKQLMYTFAQKKRISGLDYGAFDPPHIQSLKLELQLRMKLTLGIDMPELPNLKLPMLALDDLLTLLPNLPELPNFDLIAVDFPSIGIDWDALKLRFPNVPSLGKIDIPNLNMAFGSFSMNFSMPDLSFNTCCESMIEAIGDVLGALLAIVFALGEISLLTDEALIKKEHEVAKKAEIVGKQEEV